MTVSARTIGMPGCLEAAAWRFLESDYIGPAYAGWPIERRVEVFLARMGPRALLDDGSAYEALIDRVLANVGRARRRAVVAPAGTDAPAPG
ncbi:hypothetical protein BVC93_21900 [Mycobacterium sp. MS1601]|uniref:hypothetical protein n=1 Tax=Mycobacterium sp. MS1601 TaxID=1936029 RepID=UPI0009791A33|nr:hypothetical protein [Mycobacterium sp. MS1601]AQA04633.1 hypothetical protein BVC93_21900 [Mycobacterium sp. MS1601]